MYNAVQMLTFAFGSPSDSHIRHAYLPAKASVYPINRQTVLHAFHFQQQAMSDMTQRPKGAIQFVYYQPASPETMSVASDTLHMLLNSIGNAGSWRMILVHHVADI